MIVKERIVPKKITGLAALSRRLHPDHPQQSSIQDELANSKAGFGGEQNFDRHLLEFKPTYPYAILHDLCLSHNGVLFQMDSVLITPTAVLLFEIKNLAGKLVLSSGPDQLVRQLGSGESKPLRSPIAELERKKIHLAAWLSSCGIQVPIQGIVSFAYTNELELEQVSGTPILFNYQVATYLYSLRVKEERLSGQTILKLADEMAASHIEYNPFPMIENRGIPRSAILPGVFCPECGYRGMRWIRQAWVCPKCEARSRDAHESAIQDWFYLIDRRIKNKNCREFLLIGDRHVARRLLQKMNLKLVGDNKGSSYVLD